MSERLLSTDARPPAGARSVLFDTETTGLDPLGGDRVIEIACLELERDLPTGRVFHVLIDPDRDVLRRRHPGPRLYARRPRRQAPVPRHRR